MFDLYLTVRLDHIDRSDGRVGLAELVAGVHETIVELAPGTIEGEGQERPLPSSADIESGIAALPDGSFAIVPAAEPEAPLRLTIRGGRAEIDFPFASDAPNLADLALFDAASDLLCGFARRHGQSNRLGALTGLSVNSLDHRRARPPRTPLILDRNGLVDVVDARALKSPEERAEGDVLIDARLPESVIRTSCGPVAVICWASGLTLKQPRQIAEALSRRNLWLASHEVGAVSDGWSVEGDVQADPLGAQPHPGLTLYSPVLGVGYVAVHSTVPRSEREKTLAKAAAMLKARKADEASPLDNVIVVAESRDAAVALRPEIERAGLRTIVYPDDEHFWNPFPEGDWA